MTLEEIWYAYPEPTVQLPLRFQDVTWEGLPGGPIRATVERYLRGFPDYLKTGQGPVLLGRAQQYKTYAAALLSRTLVETYRVPVLWVNTPSQVAACERDRYSARTQQQVDAWQSCPVLVLDDFATQIPGSYGQQLLVAVMSARFDAMLPTVWTGNVAVGTNSPWQSLTPWGPTFKRRLYETGKGLTVFVS